MPIVVCPILLSVLVYYTGIKIQDHTCKCLRNVVHHIRVLDMVVWLTAKWSKSEEDNFVKNIYNRARVKFNVHRVIVQRSVMPGE